MGVQVKVVRLHEGTQLPQYQTTGSAGMDLHARLDGPLTLGPLERAVVPTGIAIALPEGYEAQIRARSGLSSKYGITMVNGVGTIDSDYRGEVGALVINLGNEPFIVEPGMRIAQMVVARYDRADWQVVSSLDETERGVNGFGSTGAVAAT
ncbi:Deoxyuridine 5'-triphosphate nucleotidohydrolase [compost metagenome]